MTPLPDFAFWSLMISLIGANYFKKCSNQRTVETAASYEEAKRSAEAARFPHCCF
jgi:hypothetical protein